MDLSAHINLFLEFLYDMYQPKLTLILLYPCLIGFAFLLLRKNTSKKKLFLVLSLVVPALMMLFYGKRMVLGDLFFMVAFYLAGFVLGLFFNARKKWHWALIPVFLLSAYLARAVDYALYVPSFPFGRIVDEPLPRDLKDAGADYEIQILSADAWFHNARMARLRAVGDSIFVCTLKAVCGIKDEMQDSCEWRFLKDAQIKSLKDSVEAYEEETLQELFWDGYVFYVSLFDYRRGVKRVLEIGNASHAMDGELPKAKQLEKMARVFLPPADTSAAYRDSVKHCNDLLVEMDEP